MWVLTEIPCGVDSGWHVHPGEEVGFIVAGTVQMMVQGQMLSTYSVEAGRPLATFVDGPPVTPVRLDMGMTRG